MGCIRKAGICHGGFNTHTGGRLVKVGILGILVTESKRSAHLAVVTQLKAGASHTQNNALLQDRVPTP